MSATPDPVLRVALPVPLPRDFDYRPPAGQIADAGWVGCRVRVPFGRGTGEQVGVVVGVGAPGGDPAALKPVLARLDATPLLAGELFDTLRWAAAYDHAPLGEVLATAGLLIVILVLLQRDQGGLIPVSVAAWIGSAYFFTSSTSFANPAVTVGRMFSDTFAGISPDSVLPFIGAQLVGAAIGILGVKAIK